MHTRLWTLSCAYRIHTIGYRTTVNISLNLNYCLASTPALLGLFFYLLLPLGTNIPHTRSITGINIHTFIHMYMPLSIKKANLFSNLTLITHYISDPKIFWCDLLVKWRFISTLDYMATLSKPTNNACNAN